MSSGLRFSIRAKDSTGSAFDALKRKVKGLKNEFSTLKGALRGIKPLLLAVFAGSGIKAILDASDKIDKFSLRLGISTNELTSLNYAAEQSGNTFEQLSMGLQRMTRRVAEAANGTGEAKDALAELKINAQELNQLSPDKQFRRITEALEGVTSQSDKVRLAFKLFDSEGVGLIQTMEGGVKALDKMGRKFEWLGGVVDKQAHDDLADLNDAWHDVTVSLTGIAKHVLTLLAPAFELALKGITHITAGIAKMVRWVRIFGNMARATFSNMQRLVGIISEEEYQKRLKDYTATIRELLDDTKVATNESKKLEQQIKKAEKREKKEKPKKDKEIRGKLSEWDQEALRTMDSIEDRFRDGVANILTDFDNMGDSIKNTLKDIGNMFLDNQIKQIFEGLGNTTKGGGILFDVRNVLGDLLGYDGRMDGKGKPSKGLFGGAGSFLGDIFGGFFANGGNFDAGKPIVVGERGAEVIMPRQSGTVIPNHALAGSSPIHITMHVSTPDVNSFRASQAQISTEMANAMSMAQRRHM